MIAPGAREVARAHLIYRVACQHAHDYPPAARKVWLRAGNMLGWLTAASNDSHEGEVFFLWRMARRRAMIEIGAETWGETVHQWS